MARFVTYNILAPSYANPQQYPQLPPEELSWERRFPALRAYLVSLQADVLCLQEVEEPAYRVLAAELEPRGYQGFYAQKLGKVEGCALFTRLPAIRHEHLVFPDGSGHLAQLVYLENSMLVANTHLRWQVPQQLDFVLQHLGAPAERSVVVGDFNFTPDQLKAPAMRDGLDAEPTYADRKIDYILHGSQIQSHPVKLPQPSVFLSDHRAAGSDLEIRPFSNCYWVLPQRLMAGEYPIIRDPHGGRVKLASILDAGIDSFLDLTDPADGLEPYHGLLPERAFRHRRMTIRDMDVPEPDWMREILRYLHSQLEQGRTVYVHCWGGIGRTGTVVGCHLVEQGYSPWQALEHIALRWTHMEKIRRFPRSPQTDAQVEFVLNWRKSLD